MCEGSDASETSKKTENMNRHSHARDIIMSTTTTTDDAPKPTSLVSGAVEAFISENATPTSADLTDALAGPTEKTKALLEESQRLFALERANGGVLATDAKTPSNATSHGPGYLLSKDIDDVCVGLQTEAPLTRAMKPLGGLRVTKKALAESGGAEMDAGVQKFFEDWVTTHNDAVFDIYDEEIRAARRAHLLLGLPDAYGRGRLIGDYRRVAMFGVDVLIAERKVEHSALPMETEDDLHLKFEVACQIHALERLKEMAKLYGIDISLPAKTAKECIQWTYFAYLCVCKENDGAAISLGRVDAFFDVYIERDIKAGILDETSAQELIDQFVLKLRLIRFLRTTAYRELFAGDPTWATCCVGGAFMTGEHMVTKTSWRFLQTLVNMGPAPEPNMTVLWCDSMPTAFKEFAASISIASSSIQFISDVQLREKWCSHDVSIACCVSGCVMGKPSTAQYFGARCNLPKLLLYALNNGRDEISGVRVGPSLFDDVPEGVLNYDDVFARFKAYMAWLAKLYVRTMNVIHYSHDRFNYEALMFALMDVDCRRLMAFGIAGLSVVADSLSAIKHSRVEVVRDAETNLSKEFKIDNENYPQFGNDDDAVDAIAADLVAMFIEELKKHKTHRDAEHTLSILTITSNVVYGTNTGATPDQRKAGEPFAPGANPMHNRDKNGALCSLNSVSKIPYSQALDGISNTFSMALPSLGKTDAAQRANLVALLDGYFDRGAQHLNVNVLDRAILIDAMNNPEKYPTLTIRVSGYAVNFVRLSRAHQEEVISRTFHATL